MYQRFIKRIIDLFFSIILLTIFSPLMIIIFFIVWFMIGFPIFSQKRPGLNNKIFKIYKFKTLYDPFHNIKENERVDINVLKKKLKETESKEFKKNIFIMLILFSLLAIVGIYLTL